VRVRTLNFKVHSSGSDNNDCLAVTDPVNAFAVDVDDRADVVVVVVVFTDDDVKPEVEIPEVGTWKVSGATFRL